MSSSVKLSKISDGVDPLEWTKKTLMAISMKFQKAGQKLQDIQRSKKGATTLSKESAAESAKKPTTSTALVPTDLKESAQEEVTDEEAGEEAKKPNTTRSDFERGYLESEKAKDKSMEYDVCVLLQAALGNPYGAELGADPEFYDAMLAGDVCRVWTMIQEVISPKDRWNKDGYSQLTAEISQLMVQKDDTLDAWMEKGMRLTMRAEDGSNEYLWPTLTDKVILKMLEGLKVFNPRLFNSLNAQWDFKCMQGEADWKTFSKNVSAARVTLGIPFDATPAKAKVASERINMVEQISESEFAGAARENHRRAPSRNKSNKFEPSSDPNYEKEVKTLLSTIDRSTTVGKKMVAQLERSLKTCDFCHKRGHTAAECRLKQKHTTDT